MIANLELYITASLEACPGNFLRHFSFLWPPVDVKIGFLLEPSVGKLIVSTGRN